MSKLIEAKVVSIDDDLSAPQALYIGFSDGSYTRGGVSFCYTSHTDMQELDMLLTILNITGDKRWGKKLLGKKVRLQVDYTQLSRTETKIDIRAIGSYSDDEMFLVLNSGEPLCSLEKSEKLIKKMPKKNRAC